MLLRENETKEPSTIETTYQMLNVKFVLNVTGCRISNVERITVTDTQNFDFTLYYYIKFFYKLIAFKICIITDYIYGLNYI